MDTLRLVFWVLLIVCFSVDVGVLTCTELEITYPQSVNMSHKVIKVNGESINFRVNRINCLNTVNTEVIVKVSTSEEGFKMDKCKFSLTMEKCNVTNSSECLCSPQGLAHFYTPASWSGDKNITITWTDKNTMVEKQQTIMFTSLRRTAPNYIGTLELIVLVTMTLSCVFSIVIGITFGFMVRKRRRKKVRDRTRTGRQESRNVNNMPVYDVARTFCTRGKDRNMAVQHEARCGDRTSVYDLANARGFERGESSLYSELVERSDTYLHPSPVLSSGLRRQIVAL